MVFRCFNVVVHGNRTCPSISVTSELIYVNLYFSCKEQYVHGCF
jgi:hypothetical protein